MSFTLLVVSFQNVSCC